MDHPGFFIIPGFFAPIVRSLELGQFRIYRHIIKALILLKCFVHERGVHKIQECLHLRYPGICSINYAEFHAADQFDGMDEAVQRSLVEDVDREGLPSSSRQY